MIVTPQNQIKTKPHKTKQNRTKPNGTPLPQGDTSCCHVVRAWMYSVLFGLFLVVLGVSQSARPQPNKLSKELFTP